MCELYGNKTVKYKQLTAVEREGIEAYLCEGKSISWISRELTRSKSTIFSEIKRGKHNGKYKAYIAQNRAEKHRWCSHKHCKWRNYNLLIFLETRLKRRCSPEIISAQWKKEFGQTFSHTSIYTLIKKHRPNWKKYLIYKGKK